MNAQSMRSKIALLMLTVTLVACPTTGGTTSPQPPGPAQPGQPPGQGQIGNPGYGGTMVYDAGAVIYRLDVASGRAVTIAQSCSATPDSYPDLLRSGEVAVRCGSSDIVVYKADGTTSLTLRPPDGLLSGGPKFSEDGQKIAYRSGEYPQYPVKVVTRDGALLARFPNAYAPSWLPDGRLAMLGADGVYVSDATLTEVSRIPRDGIVNPDDLAVSPGGDRIAFVLNAHVWGMNLDGSGLKQLSVSGTTESGPVWSPDGSGLAIVVDNNIGGVDPIQVRKVDSADGYKNLLTNTGSIVITNSVPSWK